MTKNIITENLKRQDFAKVSLDEQVINGIELITIERGGKQFLSIALWLGKKNVSFTYDHRPASIEAWRAYQIAKNETENVKNGNGESNKAEEPARQLTVDDLKKQFNQRPEEIQAEQARNRAQKKTERNERIRVHAEKVKAKRDIFTETLSANAQVTISKKTKGENTWYAVNLMNPTTDKEPEICLTISPKRPRNNSFQVRMFCASITIAPVDQTPKKKAKKEKKTNK